MEKTKSREPGFSYLQKNSKYYRQDIKTLSKRNLNLVMGGQPIKDLDSLISQLVTTKSASQNQLLPAGYRKVKENRPNGISNHKSAKRSVELNNVSPSSFRIKKPLHSNHSASTNIPKHSKNPNSQNGLLKVSIKHSSQARRHASAKETDLSCQSLEHKNYIRDVIDRYKMPQQTSRLPVFEQFIQLCEESSDYLDYHLKKVKTSEFAMLSDLIHSKGNTQSSTTSSSVAEKNIILCILREHYPVFKQSPKSRRILIGLNINPLDDFSKIDWPKFTKIRKLKTLKDLDVFQSARFLTRLVFPENSDQFVTKQQFKRVLKSITEKLDAKLQRLNQRALPDYIADRMLKYFEPESNKQNIVNHEAENKQVGSPSLCRANCSEALMLRRQVFKQVILEQKVFNYIDLIRLVFCNFQP